MQTLNSAIKTSPMVIHSSFICLASMTYRTKGIGSAQIIAISQKEEPGGSPRCRVNGYIKLYNVDPSTDDRREKVDRIEYSAPVKK